MAEDDALYLRDTIATLRPYELDGAWAPKLAKIRVVKAQIEEGLDPKAKKPALLVQIDEALARIQSGQYGQCVACSSEIAEDRLRTESPWITRCPPCRGKK